MNLVAVCIGRIEPVWPLVNIPFVFHGEDREAPPRCTPQRVEYIAGLRNRAMWKAVDRYADLTHVLMVDAWYLPEQYEQVEKLVEDYRNWDKTTILGAGTWTRLRVDLRKPFGVIRFNDIGATPEGLHYTLKSRGVVPVKVCGACYIFPIEAWRKNHYRADWTNGMVTEHEAVCNGFRCYLDLNVQLRRQDPKAIRPLGKLIRIAVGKRLRKLCAN